MQQDAREAYQRTQVTTAAPQNLRLMLIQGAIRVAKQTIDHWQNNRIEQGTESLIHCRQIVTELVGSVNPQQNSISKSTCDLYLFIFQSLTIANQVRDITRIEDVIRILEVEQETWQQICEQLSETASEQTTRHAPGQITTSDPQPSSTTSISFNA